jgi:protoporphyrinogen oxidase
MYFRELSFNRITDLSHFGIEIVPKGHSLIIAEISCDKNDRFWTDDRHSIETVTDQLVKEDIVARNLIKEAHVFRAEHAYPLFTLGFEEHLEKTLKGVEAHGKIRTTGRQGSFKYVNIHVAMKMGYEAADSLINA